MFAYSIRPGTVAGDRSDQVPESVKKRRLNELIELQNSISTDSNLAKVGTVAEVLVEGVSRKTAKTLQGYSRDFRMVHFVGSENRTGRIAKVKLKEAHQWGLLGELE
jgi:tRNA-2-methylthio-N6-dimethylallyladenosine synthase